MKIPKIGKENRGEIIELPVLEPVAPETSPEEIDSHRARHTLDRAVQLAEKGNYPGAILAARQAIALDHDFGDAHSVLGGLLERTGDLKGAFAAHTRAVSLMPNSALEHATLERLQQKLGAASPGLENTQGFNFNDSELFDPQTELPLDVDARLPPTRVEMEQNASAQQVQAPDSPDKTSESGASPVTAAPNLSDSSTRVAVNTVSPSGVTEAEPNPHPAGGQPVILSEPLATEPITIASPPEVVREALSERVPVKPLFAREGQNERLRPSDAALLAARGQTAGTPFVFNPLTDAPKPPLWAQTLRGPSFFARTLPLMAVTIFSLGFLSWATGRAVEQTPIAPTDVNSEIHHLDAQDPITLFEEPQESVSAPGPNLAPARQNTVNAGGFDINNRAIAPPVAAASSSAATSGTVSEAAPRRATIVASSNPRPVEQRPSPVFPSQQLPPAVITAPARPNAGSGNSELRLPPPQVERSAPVEPPTRILPPDNNGAVGSDTAAGSPPDDNALNTAGSPARGYVKIQPGRSALSAPVRSQNQANDAEREAANAALTGQNDRAIQNLTTAINSNASDAAFRLQQRANLFLEQGDYARAADDFQAAINAYQNQIARGEDVAGARSGLRSARSGLNRAASKRDN